MNLEAPRQLVGCRPHRWVAIALLLVCLAPVAAWGPENKVYLSSAMKSGTKAPRAVVMLAPTVSKQVGGTWTILRIEDSAELSQQFASYLTHALTQAGWETDKDSLTEESVAADARVRNLVAFLRERHAQMIREMLSRPKDVTKGRFSFGSDVADLGVSARADVLVLAHLDAFKPPKLLKAFLVVGSFGTLLPRWKALDLWTLLRMSLVDPVSGEVLCFIDVQDARLESLSKTLKQLRGGAVAEDRREFLR